MRMSYRLYSRCSLFKQDLALPESGGVMDQTEIIMQILETIHGEMARYEKKTHDDLMFRLRAQQRVQQNRSSMNVGKNFTRRGGR